MNRFFRRAPFFSRLLVRQPTRALPTYLPTHLSNHHLCSQLFRRRNSGNVTSKFGFQIQVHDLTELAPHGFSCQTNACRGYARISEIKSGYHQMSEFKRALLFYFSLSLSLFFSSFLFSFHFFLQLSLSLFFSPFRRCSAYLYEKYHSTIEHAYPPPEVRVHYSRLVFFFPSFFNSLKAFRCFLLLHLFFVGFRPFYRIRTIYMCIYIYMYDYFEHFRAPLSRIVLEMFNSFL